MDPIGYYGSDRAREAYSWVMTNMAHPASPFSDYYNTSVSSSGAPQGLMGIAFNFFTSRLLGTTSPPFRLQNPFERPAGDLGAYGLSRFEGNAARMGAGAGVIRSQSRAAASQILNSPFLKRTADNPNGLFSEDMINKASDWLAHDETGLGDMIVNTVARFAGAGDDYGITGTRVAKNAEAFMTRAQRAAAAASGYGSENWKNMIGATTQDVTKAMRSLMYENEGNSFVRKEEFMRGFSETDVSSILEKVAASATNAEAANGHSSPEALKSRLETVGGAAIKTLEAFKELFGSADKAKQMLNGLTGGGFTTMNEEDFNSLTNQARGMMQLGMNAGVNHDVLASMLNMVAAGVQNAMGYTPEDVAGGYVNNNIVNGVSNAFVAQELSDMGVSDISMLDEQEQQRLKARAAKRASEFAGSTANRYMTAATAAFGTGAMSEQNYNEVMRMFESGDREQMSDAADRVAEALGISKDAILDEHNFKIFSDTVGRDRALVERLADSAVKAQNNEITNVGEFSIANAGLNRAQNALKTVGYGNQEVVDMSNATKVESITAQLQEMANSGDVTAKGILESMGREKNATDKLKAFDKARSLLEDGRGDIIMTNATATAQNKLNDMAYNVYDTVDAGVAARLKDKGAALNENGQVRRIDLANLAQSTINTLDQLGRGNEATKLRDLLENKDFAGLSSALGSVLKDETVSYSAYKNAIVSNAEGPERAQGSSKLTMAGLVSALTDSNGEGLGRRESLYNGKREEEFDVNEYLGIKDKDEALDFKLPADRTDAKSREVVRKFQDILGDDSLSGVKKANALNELAASLSEEEMKNLKTDLTETGGVDAEAGSRMFEAISRARKSKPEEVKGAFTVGGNAFRIQDVDNATKNVIAGNEELQAAFKDMTTEQVWDAIRNMSPDDSTRQAFFTALKNQPGVVQTGNEAADDGKKTFNETLGLADAGASIGGGLAGSDIFEQGLSKLGDKADMTAKQVKKLGETITNIVNSKETSNVNLAQALVSAFSDPNNPENINKVVDSVVNANTSPEAKAELVEKLMGLLKVLAENVEKIAGNTESTARSSSETAAAANEN